ncbi:phage tail tape measure protein [Deinococcus arboris]|nr:phage tail tape measure protein [Deinococcus arboris]
MTQTSLGDLVLSPTLDQTQFWAEFSRLQQQLEREQGVKVKMNTGEALTSLDSVKQGVAELGNLTKEQATQQTRNARVLGAQHQASAQAIREHNAAVLAEYRSNTAASKAEAAATVERTTRIREQAAQLTLTNRLASQAARDEKQRSIASINALDQQTRAYRNLWQARQLSDDEVIAAQRRIHSQALIQAQAVDKTSDAYRRLTQVAAAAQRTMDQASGQNTPGSFSAGVSQGVLSALGNLGPFGQLAEQLGMIYQQYRSAQTEMRDAGADVGRAAGDGLSEGLRARQDEVKKEGHETGEALHKGVKDALDIRSPSRVLRQAGTWAADGFIDGLKAKHAEALQAGRSLGQQAQRGLQSVNLSADFGISGGTGLGLFSRAGAGESSGMAAAAADTKEAVDALNGLPEAAKQAELGAAGMEIAAEGMGGAVEQAAEHVQSLRDAHREADPAARATAIAEARNAVAFAATSAAVGALAYARVTGIKTAAEYEAGLAEISLLTDKLPSQLGPVGMGILKVGAEVHRGFSELKEGYEEILGASVRGTSNEPEALRFLERAANLAKVTRTETQVAANALTSLLNAYEMDASKAGQVSDMLWASVAAGKVKLGEIAGSLGAVAGQAKSLDVPLEELLGAMALLTTRGIPASTALEYIRSALTNVQKPTEQAKDTASRLGIEFSAAALKGMGLVKFLEQLGKGVGDDSEALATLIGDVGGLQAVIGLLNGGLDDTGGVLDRVTNSSGELDRQVAKLKGTAEDAGKNFYASWERTQILFSRGLLGAFTNFLDKGVNPVLKAIGDVRSDLEGLHDIKDIRAVLTIDWAKDDGTTMAYKVFLGAQRTIGSATTPGEGPVGKVLNTLLYGPLGALLQYGPATARGVSATYTSLERRQTAIDLRDQLIKANLMERGDFKQQVEAILKNLDGYVDQMREHVQKGSEAIAGTVKATLKPLVGEGPLLPGQGRASDITGLALATLLGVGQRSRGTPFGQTYGPNGSWGKHVGEDFFAPVGTPVYAPFAGYASVRKDQQQGNIVDLYDADNKRLSMIHLDKYADGLVEAIARAGGRLLVKQGELLATVGQSGDAAHKELGTKNAHLHFHALVGGQLVDPFSQTFRGVTGNANAARTYDSKAKPPPVEKTFDDYLKEARRLTDAVEKYAPGGKADNKDRWLVADRQLESFRTSGELAGKALEYIGLESGKAKKATSEFGQQFDKLKGQLDITSSLDNLGRPAAEVTTRLEAIRKEALSGAEAERKRWGETAKYKALLDLAGDAAKRLEQVRKRTAELTPLQREQAQQQDLLARERMEKSLRGAGADRLQELVAGGVTPDVSLAKWQAAQAEIRRREDLAEQERHKNDDAALKASENRLAAQRALADGQLELAQRRAGEVLKTYDLEVKKAGDSAEARLSVEERLAANVLAARAAQAEVAARQERLRLERERNTAVNAQSLTLKDRQALWAQYGERIAQVNQDLIITLDDLAETAVQHLADVQQQAFSESEAGRAEAYAERLRAIIEGLPGQSEDGLIRLYGEARAVKDQELLKAVYDEWERRRLEEEAAQRVIFELQDQANTALAEGAKKTADELAAAGDSDGALAVLEEALSGVMEAALAGEDAAQAINLLHDAISNLTGATALTDEFNTFVAGLSGTVDEQISQVVARLEEVTDPALRTRLQGLLKDLRADLPSFGNPYASGLIPGANGFANGGQTGGAPDLKDVAQARDLGQLLAEATDPTQVQGLLAEVAELLASEIGERLPPSIRAGLESAVAGAQNYLDVLTNLTTEGVVDGWERGMKGALENPLPSNRFSEFAAEIFGRGAAGLSDQGQVDALTETLQQARAESQLTEADLQNLLALIEQLRNPSDVQLGQRFNLGQWQQDVQTLSDQFDSGEITAQDYAAGLREASVQLNALADEAERFGNLKLAGQIRDLAGGLRAMSPEVAGAMKTLGTVQEYAGYVQDLAGAFSSLAEASGNEDLAANLNGLGNLAGKVAALAGDVMRIIANPADIGAWVGAITKIISGIAEAMNGFRQAYEKADKMREDFNKRFTLIRGDDFAKTFVRSRGWLADTFGGGPEIRQDIDEFGLKIAQSIEGGVLGGIKNGMKQALMTGDWSGFSETFRESAYSGVVDGLIEAIFNDALKEILAPGIKALTDAAKTEGTADDDAAMAMVERQLGQAEQFVTGVGQRLQPGLDRLRDNLGVKVDPGTTRGVDTTGLSTLPEPVQFALAAPLVDGVRGLKEAAEEGKKTAMVQREVAELMRDVLNGFRRTSDGAGSYRSTTGTLAGS